MQRRRRVVNCFQKSYLWLLNTTGRHPVQRSERCELLSKILSLTIEHNSMLFILNTPCCCELLSKILSLTIEHNELNKLKKSLQVVNCFQKSYLWLLNTTQFGIKSNRNMLWIAFKNLIFDYWTQLIGSRLSHWLSCELLSKILSLTIEHNNLKH